MKATRIWLTLAVAGLAVAVVSAQGHYDYEDEEQAQRETKVPPAGFWPTDRMLELAFDRISEALADQYAFDEDQMWNTRDVLKDRFPRWMKDNRAEIQTLMNQYFEALIAGEPPSAEEVAAWAARAQPVINEFADLIEHTTDDMREYMTYEQQVLLDGELAAFSIGRNYLNQRMSIWREGGYDWETEWPRSEEFRRIEKDRKARLDREVDDARLIAMGLEPNPAPTDDAPDGGGGAEPSGKPDGKTEGPKLATPKRDKDPWEDYVASFIARYKLSEGQQNSAHKFLRSLQERRDLYLRRKLAAITSIEEQVAAAKTDEERQKLWARLEELNAPLERYFQQLKDKLDTLPTRKQRREAAQAQQGQPKEAERTAQKPGE